LDIADVIEVSVTMLFHRYGMDKVNALFFEIM